MGDESRVDEFVQLFTRHESRLRSLARSLVLHAADTDDVLQQAYLTLWKRFDQFQSGTNFVAWAGRVIYIHVLRHRKRLARDKVVFDDAFLEAVMSVSTDEPFAAELEERERHLRDCLQQLRPEHRAMLRARYEDDSSTETMAAIFNRSGQAIYNALFRIRKRLFDCMTEKLNPEKLTPSRQVRHGS